MLTGHGEIRTTARHLQAPPGVREKGNPHGQGFLVEQGRNLPVDERCDDEFVDPDPFQQLFLLYFIYDRYGDLHLIG